VAEKAGGQRCEVYYSGRVQGVGFRYTVRSLATGFRVTGFVRNLRDGRVEVVAEGLPDELQQFLDAIGREMGRFISQTQQTARPASGEFASFDVRF